MLLSSSPSWPHQSQPSLRLAFKYPRITSPTLLPSHLHGVCTASRRIASTADSVRNRQCSRRSKVENAASKLENFMSRHWGLCERAISHATGCLARVTAKGRAWTTSQEHMSDRGAAESPAMNSQASPRPYIGYALSQKTRPVCRPIQACSPRPMAAAVISGTK